MFAEAIHSTVDTGNELLLTDSLHPYGHGKAVSSAFLDWEHAEEDGGLVDNPLAALFDR